MGLSCQIGFHFSQSAGAAQTRWLFQIWMRIGLRMLNLARDYRVDDYVVGIIL
jgi:hypothetical protein